jgi:predicted dehydrogenase
LVRWRLFNRTGGGLMAELGSHQLDACSIFLSRHDGQTSRPVRPIAVTAVGGKHFYTDNRDVDDHVYCIYEFPGKTYPRNTNDRVVVTYSSINTNGFEPYGECVMGTKGTLVVSQEETAMLWGTGGRSTSVSVTPAGALDSSGSVPGSASAGTRLGQDAIGSETPSRGYREEMEHLAFIIRNLNQGMSSDRERPEMKLRCDGEKAMADAIMALTANLAMDANNNNRRIEFQDAWYNVDSNEVPDGNRVANPFLRQ